MSRFEAMVSIQVRLTCMCDLMFLKVRQFYKVSAAFTQGLTYYVIFTFRFVGLGSYLRAHVCHSYPGPLYCVVSSIIWLSSNNLFLTLQLDVVVSFVLVSCLVVYNKCRSQ